MSLVLDGIRVLDLSTGIAGPMATMLLADHGADVTRIERPGEEPLRSQLGHHAWNRGKRSAVLDLKNADDKRAFLALARDRRRARRERRTRRDETARHRLRDAFGARNPRLIYCSITGYGRDNRLLRPPGLRRARRRALGPAVGAARTPRRLGTAPVGQAAALSRPRGRAGTAPGRTARGTALPRLALPEPRRGLRRGDGDQRGAARARGDGARTMGRDLAAAGRARLAACSPSRWREKLETPMFMSWVGDSRSPKGLFECRDGRWIHAWPPNPRFILSAGAGEKLNATPDLQRSRDDPDRIGLGVEEIFVLDHYWEPMAETVRKFTADEWTGGRRDRADLHPEGPLARRGARGSAARRRRRRDGARRSGAREDPRRRDPLQARALAGEIRSAAPAPRPAHGRGQGRGRGAAREAGRGPRERARGDARRGTPTLAKGPLDGITVLDFGLAVAGPYARADPVGPRRAGHQGERAPRLVLALEPDRDGLQPWQAEHRRRPQEPGCHGA